MTVLFALWGLLAGLHGYAVRTCRARDRAELLTDDRAGLKEQLEALTSERIAAVEALGGDKAKALETAKGREMDAEAGQEHGPSRVATPEKTPEPKLADRDFGS